MLVYAVDVKHLIEVSNVFGTTSANRALFNIVNLFGVHTVYLCVCVCVCVRERERVSLVHCFVFLLSMRQFPW